MSNCIKPHTATHSKHTVRRIFDWYFFETHFSKVWTNLFETLWPRSWLKLKIVIKWRCNLRSNNQSILWDGFVTFNYFFLLLTIDELISRQSFRVLLYRIVTLTSNSIYHFFLTEFSDDSKNYIFPSSSSTNNIEKRLLLLQMKSSLKFYLIFEVGKFVFSVSSGIEGKFVS